MFKRDKRFKQGEYTPANPEKYIGKRSPVYRSSWELKFFRWADLNEKVIKWGSENIIIPYINPISGTGHRYFVDCFIIYKDIKGKEWKFLIEIKPFKQTKAPENKKYKHKKTIIYEQTTWVKNQAKWSAAVKYCKKRGWKFMILTEKELGLK